MKDKEKQIEEMAKIMRLHICKDRPCKECDCHGLGDKTSELYHCDCYYYAKSLVEQGYRKPHEDSVVISKEEYQEYKNLVKLFIYDKPIKSRVYEFIKDTKEQARKETAEKILKDLIKNCQYTFGVNGKPIIALDGDFALNTAKEFGVEITDNTK